MIPSRRFEYGVELDAEWTARSDRGGRELPADDSAWTPEHLLLASLCRCTLTSLRHHAGKAGVSVASQGRARGTVARRAEDGRYAFVELDVELGVALDPLPAQGDRAGAVGKAERDCFVGASLTKPAVYRWRVNGDDYR